jgi:hypothetical protein
MRRFRVGILYVFLWLSVFGWLGVLIRIFCETFLHVVFAPGFTLAWGLTTIIITIVTGQIAHHLYRCGETYDPPI